MKSYLKIYFDITVLANSRFKFQLQKNFDCILISVHCYLENASLPLQPLGLKGRAVFQTSTGQRYRQGFEFEVRLRALIYHFTTMLNEGKYLE